jgi:hypothetical protein
MPVLSLLTLLNGPLRTWTCQSGPEGNPAPVAVAVPGSWSVRLWSSDWLVARGLPSSRDNAALVNVSFTRGPYSAKLALVPLQQAIGHGP